ncbi:MAG TPA: helix-turn-helix domain-containing protein [Gemmataceae bacterium]|nr:helix-turn-helix domain-containing protein [Gemmataceae bacterium]
MNESEIPDDLITPAEAGKLLKTTAASIRRAIRKGTLPAYRVLGKLMLSKADVLAQFKRADTETGIQLPTRKEIDAGRKKTQEILKRARIT